MFDRRIILGAILVITASFVMLLVLGDAIPLGRVPHVAFVYKEVSTSLMEGDVRWTALLCLECLGVSFLAARCRGSFGFLKSATLRFLLFLVLAIGLSVSVGAGVPSFRALLLLCGLVIGQATGLLIESGHLTSEPHIPTSARPERGEIRILYMLIIILAAGSVWPNDEASTAAFSRLDRWSGVWGNPNQCGLLAGCCMVLSSAHLVAGLFVANKPARRTERLGRWMSVVLCLAVIFLTGRALWHSYSRGAWLAVLIASIFASVSLLNAALSTLKDASEPQSANAQFNVHCHSLVLWAKRNWFCLPLLLGSLAVIAFWHFQHTKLRTAHRVFSSINLDDFSRRNRVVAWKGALEMIAEHPWAGEKLGQPGRFYENYYLQAKVIEGGAIETNDYLMLGATLGIPVLFCFGVFLWLSLIQKLGVRGRESEMAKRSWLRTTCRAGAIVLLVGFWFDGGLFKLPTASTFWILLELGRNDLQPTA